MESIRMVKCYVTRDEKEKGSVRFVPLEIYEMWRFLMERAHQFIIVDPKVSNWIPAGPTETESNYKPPAGNEPVVEIKFIYRKSADMEQPVTRYFPAENFDLIYGYFRKHFPDESKMDGVKLRKGYYLESKAQPYQIP